jgi:hypothetical protein
MISSRVERGLEPLDLGLDLFDCDWKDLKDFGLVPSLSLWFDTFLDVSLSTDLAPPNLADDYYEFWSAT